MAHVRTEVTIKCENCSKQLTVVVGIINDWRKHSRNMDWLVLGPLTYCPTHKVAVEKELNNA